MCLEKQQVWWRFETQVASGEQIIDAHPQEFKEYIPSPPHPVRQFFAYPGVNQTHRGMLKTAPNLKHVRQTCQAHLLELQKEMVAPPTFGHATERLNNMSVNFAAKLAKLVKSSKVANPTPVYEPISVPMINQGLNLEPQVLALQVAKHRNWVIERGGESIYAITANGPELIAKDLMELTAYAEEHFWFGHSSISWSFVERSTLGSMSKFSVVDDQGKIVQGAGYKVINTQKNSQGYVPVVVPAFNEELTLSHQTLALQVAASKSWCFELGGANLFTLSGELLATNIAALANCGKQHGWFTPSGSIDWGNVDSSLKTVTFPLKAE